MRSLSATSPCSKKGISHAKACLSMEIMQVQRPVCLCALTDRMLREAHEDGQSAVEASGFRQVSGLDSPFVADGQI